MRERHGTMTGGATLLALALALALPAGAVAQAGDSPWLAWAGCWVPADAFDDDAPLTCIRPTRDGGAEFLTVAPDGALERRHVLADGIERPTRGTDCPGVESAGFSADGARVYLRAEHHCRGSIGRSSTGLMAMVDRDRWLDARSMDVGGRSAGWVEVYVPASRSRARAAGMGDVLDFADGRRSAVAAARAFASAAISIDDILEAHARTDPEVVRAWLAEQQHRLVLDRDGLRRLAAAGVPGDVIDVAVAIAYPERFALARDPVPVDDRVRRDRYRGPRPAYRDPFWSPYYGYGYYGYGYGWGAGFYDPYFHRWHRPTVIVVDPRDPAPRARAVPGRGYTRGGAAATSGGGREVRAPRRPDSSTPSASSGERRTTGTSTGRTARPRGGGDPDPDR